MLLTAARAISPKRVSGCPTMRSERTLERDANAPGVLRYNPDEVETAAYGPRKGLNPPIKNLRQSETLTSSPRDADAGR